MLARSSVHSRGTAPLIPVFDLIQSECTSRLAPPRLGPHVRKNTPQSDPVRHSRDAPDPARALPALPHRADCSGWIRRGPRDGNGMDTRSPSSGPIHRTTSEPFALDPRAPEPPPRRIYSSISGTPNVLLPRDESTKSARASKDGFSNKLDKEIKNLERELYQLRSDLILVSKRRQFLGNQLLF